jgi:spermidine synthase
MAKGFSAKKKKAQRAGTDAIEALSAKNAFQLSLIRMYSPHVLAFLSGGIVLLLEVLGARILAPYLGTAFSVWVNIIGTILASLSLGYYAGGVLADRNQRLLPHIFLAGAVCCALVYFERPLLPRFGSLGLGWGSFLAAVLFFAPPSMVLGMVSPYLLKLAATDPEQLGRTSGGIFAASTVGSIAGTFLGGFWLIPHFRISYILAGMVALLLVIALGCARDLGPGWSILVAAVALAVTLAAAGMDQRAAGSANRTIFEKNSEYYNIRVNDIGDGSLRVLLLDGTAQGARYVGLAGMPFPYIRFSANIIQRLKPAPPSALVLGGGAYSIPEFIKRYSPDTNVTVVEIDPDVIATAKRFFLDDPDIPIATISADARVFLNENRRQFDVIYTDVYSGGNSVPADLASCEAFQAMKRALKPDGIIVFNIASALKGRKSLLYQSLIKTIGQVFPAPVVFSMKPAYADAPQNIVVVAANVPLAEDAFRDFDTLRYRQSPHDGMLLTDDYAPTDYLAAAAVRASYPMLRTLQ